MSNSNSPDKSSVPTAILVAKRAAPKPALKSKPIFDVNIPWMKIAIGGTIGFQAVLAVVGLFYLARGERQQLDDDFLDQQPIKVEKPIAKAEPPIVEPKDAPLINDGIVECARIGTEVRFMKEPAAAFQRARVERKMVFMVHLSGNLEDKEFT